MNNNTILVTGSSGFIGYFVTKRLLQMGATVIGVDNLNDYYDVELKKARNEELKKFEKYYFQKKDISDMGEMAEVFAQRRIDKICHLAAQAGVRYSLQNPSLYVRTNVEGFINVLEIARRYEIKDVVYASSSSVYGNNSMPTNGFSEKDAVNEPISVYGMTKRANELTAYSYHHLYGMNFTGLRFFTAYGPWGRPDMAYYNFTKAILEGQPIKVFNHGKMKRDFTYIDDVVDGVIKAIEKPFPYEIFNIGNSNTVELRYFIECIEKEVGKKASIEFLPLQQGDVVETFANIDKAKIKLQFNPTSTIDEGIKNFVQWFREYYQ